MAGRCRPRPGRKENRPRRRDQRLRHADSPLSRRQGLRHRSVQHAAGQPGAARQRPGRHHLRRALQSPQGPEGGRGRPAGLTTPTSGRYELDARPSSVTDHPRGRPPDVAADRPARNRDLPRVRDRVLPQGRRRHRSPSSRTRQGKVTHLVIHQGGPRHPGEAAPRPGVQGAPEDDLVIWSTTRSLERGPSGLYQRGSHMSAPMTLKAVTVVSTSASRPMAFNASRVSRIRSKYSRCDSRSGGGAWACVRRPRRRGSTTSADLPSAHVRAA